ncbi:MAG: serine/threonine protein kinase [Burkholderiales bacterium]|nr:serine/threonine protein kinase [Burkholderiales bacterium]
MNASVHAGEQIRQLGRYELLSELGQGAMGVVYRARDPVLERVVAIKTINLTLPKDELPEYEGRFYQEARAAGGLNHPNIVTIYDIGKSDKVAYMAMELLEGEELRSILADRQPLPVPLALDIGMQVAEGLAYAHERQVVHRDIKPANIMIVRDGLVKITDFGIARMRTNEVKTMTGMILGSPKYMAPEQVVGKRVDHRADIFSLGVVLYEMLTGEAPFVADSVHGILYQVLNHTPPAPSTRNSQSPPLLDLIVAKALAKNLEQRYDNAKDLAQDLRQCRDMLAARAAAPEFTAGTAAPSAGAPRLGIPGTGERTGGLGLSQTFDSHEATMRLAALSSADAEPMERTQRIVPEAGTPAPGRAAPSPARRDGFGDSIYLWLASALAVAAAVALIWAR